MHFKIITPTYNSEDCIENCLISIVNQDYDDFECIITDDCSTDGTVDVINNFINDNGVEDYFTLNVNEDRKYALYNLYSMIKEMDADDEDVIVSLDGDDWFFNNSVLTRLDEIYEQEDCWLTYGSYVVYPSGHDSTFHVTPYPEETIKNGDYRKDPQWRASHLRTFKHKLANKLEREDMLDEDGTFYDMAYDQALMYPMLEMAREKVHFVSDFLMVYNDDNPINEHKVDRQRQIEVAERMKTRHEKKDRLEL